MKEKIVEWLEKEMATLAEKERIAKAAHQWDDAETYNAQYWEVKYIRDNIRDMLKEA